LLFSNVWLKQCAASVYLKSIRSSHEVKI